MAFLKSKALFIVEGAKGEVNLVKRLSKLFKMDVEFVSVCANIYMLYRKLKNDDFNVDIAQVLLESKDVKECDKCKLRGNTFAYTYLIFDLDLQHCDISDPKKISHGLDAVMEMVSHFQNETDGTIGKIYINYPMLESYRDCKTFQDEDYLNQEIKLEVLKEYKQIVSNRGNSINLSKYTKQDFCDIILVNLLKASYIVLRKQQKPTYNEYLNKITQLSILLAQNEYISVCKSIKVLNTSLFVVIDYFGNRQGFYDNL